MNESKTEASVNILHGKAGLSKKHKGAGEAWEMLLGKFFYWMVGISQGMALAIQTFLKL